MSSKGSILFLILIPALLFGGVIEKGISFSQNELHFSKVRGYDVVRLEGCTPIVDIGKPELAYRPLLVLIPADAVVKNLEVVSSEKVMVSDHVMIMPCQYPEPLTINPRSRPFVKPDKEIYNLSAEYPGVLTDVVNTGTKGGFRIVTINVYPLQYVPTKGDLYLYKDIRFKLTFEQGKVSPERAWQDEYDNQKEAVKRLIINPEDVERWSPEIKTVNRFEQDDTTFVNPEFAIMTADAYASDFQPLRDWKCKKGVPTEIYTLTWIHNNVSGANDTVKVRNFVSDYNQHHGTHYFLFVGDWNIFPVKRVNTVDDPNTPSDFWFADYDGDWYTEAYVGRASVGSATEAQTFVNKTMKYERESPSTGFHEKIFMPAYTLWSNYGCPVNDTIALYDPPSWHDAKRYDFVTPLSTAEISDSFNVGFGYTDISAHGNEIGWGSATTIYHNTSNADALTNAPPKTGVITAICCLIGALDYSSGDCYVEHMMNNSHGGAAAFWGNTRHGYGQIDSKGRSEWQCIWFYDELNNHDVYNIGKTVGATNDRCVPYISDDYVKHCMNTCMLFGDPQMEMWQFFPNPMTATHNGTVPVGPSTFTVTVTDSTAPIADARVCVMCKIDPEYQVGLTNASGVATFNINPQTVDDTLWVTATKLNYRNYEGYAVVKTIGVGEEITNKPHIFGLPQPYPNPTKSLVNISFSIPNDERVKLVAFNSAGQQVAKLVDSNQRAGVHSVTWKGQIGNRRLPAGIYIIRLTAGKETAVRKVVLLAR